MQADQVYFPRPSDGRTLGTFDWTPIRYRDVIAMLKNPFDAGIYAYVDADADAGIALGFLACRHQPDLLSE